MQIGQTNLQEQRQNEQTANNMLAAAPASINPNNANVDPWQGVRDSANEYIKTSRTVTPPSEGEIHKRMWESSMMTGLIITLATGNVAGGLAAGMWGAVAVHDYGYTLRQRAEHVPQLQAEGYSMPAILKWYEDGDNSELDKERMEKEKVREFDLGRQDRNEQFRESQDEKVREFNAGQQLSREQMGQQMAIAQMHEAGANARAAMAAENARDAAARSGFTQMNMQHRQALMNAAKMDADQFRAMTRSQAAADKAVADAKLGSPIALQQMLLMGQLIDAPNASVKLSQLHHISEGAAHGVIDKAMQTANRLASGEPVTDSQMHELLQVIAVGHQAQTDTYYKQVGRQAKRYRDDLLAAQSAAESNPSDATAQQQVQAKTQDYEDFASAAGLNPQELNYAVKLYAASPKVMDEHHDAQTFGDAYAEQKGATDSNEVKWK
ncbi:hypothetical protein [Klebsiella aerogenes]|uniref:hypothetical protein n=1 Tax=Klebsiella aerogenes TaxID=548 RepID=UPI001CC60140|nr:hypothetical protein [Klebsiella aerogenes]UNX66907.1 hypothetical protein MQE04_18265 [Klebsiella aerogenes]HCR0680453.1 hypothetical protein [Klebsiella aerogenes]